MSNNPYREHDKVVDNDRATEILKSKGVEIEDKTGLDAINTGLRLGYLMLLESHTADDFTHGPFETYMLSTHGIIVDQPNPLKPYTVYHVVEIGYTGGNE